ncbi:peptidyl-prolyl cis-trans isomerase [Gemmatimonadota bacterium]
MTTGINGFRRIRHIGVAICSTLLLISATGCGGNKEDDGGVIARVNGYKITMLRFQEYYRPALSPFRTAEEEYITVEERLDELIQYKLIEEQAREDGFLKDPMFRRRLQSHNKTVLNQLVKMYEVDNTIAIDSASVEAYLARAENQRHFLHIITLLPEAANQVAEMLTAGEDWSTVAVQYSRDSDVSEHEGDLGWLVWDEGPLGMYEELQEIAYQIPVGSWRGPIQQGNEYHFIKVLEERVREKGTPEEDWQNAYAHLSGKRALEIEQELSNGFWEAGEYYLDEDQFRWLLDQIQASFNTNRNLNPVPVLTPEDAKRIVVRSREKPWTAEMLLSELELMSSPSRDNAETYEAWRSRVLGWVLEDRIAEYARTKGYHKDPLFKRRETIFIDTALYVEQLSRLRGSVERKSDEALEQYINEHPEIYDVPETRSLVEVLLQTREEAEEVLSQVRGGSDIEAIANERTIRPGFRDYSGRFNPIRREEFGPLGEAVFEAELNELGPVVETPLGFSVFRVTQIIPPRKYELNDVKENLRERLFQEEREAVVERFLEQSRRRANIWKDYERLRKYAADISAATVASDSTGTASAQDPPSPELNR